MEESTQREVFDIITSPSGSSTLSIPLWCATVELHYRRTTGVNEQNSEKCSTGLRVYEGAQVLAAFLFQYLKILMGPPPHPSVAERVGILELGCGCGLAGFCAAHCLQDAGERINVIFTDASPECLELVRLSGSLQGISVETALGSEPSIHCTSAPEKRTTVHGITFPLVWGDKKQVRKLSDRLSTLPLHSRLSCDTGCAHDNVRLPLILGSDIMYFRVDVHRLVSTIAALFAEFSAKEVFNRTSVGKEGIPSLAVLSHFMRIPNGRQQLWNSCQASGLGIVRVNLAAFLDLDVVLSRGWGGLEVVLVFPKSRGEVLLDTEVGDELLKKKWKIDKDDVEKVRSMLRKWIRISKWDEESHEKHLGNTLLQHIEPYSFCIAEEPLIWPDL